ncbi:hypothetical protein AB833_19840 [Chromatiales bacterium (ex Bugula neritina AB1)]|nr:hypothetical protein AB833_19840 [Chromatiales bacterium (ex Bugula neritina AB1)]
MGKLKNAEVAAVYQSLPVAKRKKLLQLRDLIFETAADNPELGEVEESLKWGEPSYVTPKGSAVRLAWQSKKPDCYGLYFHCQSNLIETFRELYPDELTFDGKRAIVFHEKDVVPVEIVRHCIFLALNYHKLKNLPMLGV